MWKLVVGFLILAAVVIFVIMKAGDKVDLSGEKHGALRPTLLAATTHRLPNA